MWTLPLEAVIMETMSLMRMLSADSEIEVRFLSDVLLTVLTDVDVSDIYFCSTCS
jgi:hypothetical protein